MASRVLSSCTLDSAANICGSRYVVAADRVLTHECTTTSHGILELATAFSPRYSGLIVDFHHFQLSHELMQCQSRFIQDPNIRFLESVPLRILPVE